MLHPKLWAKVPLMWGPVPAKYLTKGKSMREMLQAYQARTIEIAVDYDNVVQWRRFIHNETLELGL